MKRGNSKLIFVISGTLLLFITMLVTNVEKSLISRPNGDPAPINESLPTNDEPEHNDNALLIPLTFSHPGGLYLESFYLEIESEIKDAIIYFTLDGTMPVFGDSIRFARPIYIFDRTQEENLLSAILGYRIGCFIVYRADYFIPPEEPVFKATVLRVQAFDTEGNPLSEVITNSYFVNEDIFERYAGLPIISLVTNADYFFCDEIGIYVRGHDNQGGHQAGDPTPNWEQRGRDWERPAHMEFFESDGERVVAMNLGIRIHGGDSRRLAQKSLRLYARSYYDPQQSRIRHDVFQGAARNRMDEPITNFSRLVLRNAGNEGRGSMFRDAGIQFLSRHLQVDTQATRTAVVFLNGEFWGLYNIRERFDEWYVASHYGLNRHDIAILDVRAGMRIQINAGNSQDYQDFRELEAFIEASNLEDDAVFRFVERYINIDSFMDAYIANIFFGNRDWPSNNQRFWRYNGDLNHDVPESDGRWNWMLIDLDATTGFVFSFNYYEDTLIRLLLPPGEREITRRDFTATTRSIMMFRNLMQNEGFRQAFVNRFTDLMNIYFTENLFLEMIENFSSKMRPVMPEQITRYGRIDSMEDWEDEIEAMRAFARNRHEYMLGFLQENLNLGETVNISTSTDQTQGQVSINGTLLPANWNGIYFEGMPQTLYAHPNEGYVFDRFVISIYDNIIEYVSNPLQLGINHDIKIEAIFASIIPPTQP